MSTKSTIRVALPLANRLKKCVAMDVKFYKSNILLHMIDHTTRLLVTAIVPSKKPEHIANASMKYCVAVYGSANTFLTSNGGEFVNNELLCLCEALNISLQTPGPKLPWSNELKLVLSEMLRKVLEDTCCSLNFAIAWILTAKNSLQNVHCFLAFEFAIGQNPSPPCAFNYKLPAMSTVNHKSSGSILIPFIKLGKPLL